MAVFEKGKWIWPKEPVFCEMCNKKIINPSEAYYQVVVCDVCKFGDDQFFSVERDYYLTGYPGYKSMETKALDELKTLVEEYQGKSEDTAIVNVKVSDII